VLQSPAADATIETRARQLEANDVLLGCPDEMQAIMESHETDGNAAFAGRTTSDQCRWKIAILLRQSESNLGSGHRISKKHDWRDGQQFFHWRVVANEMINFSALARLFAASRCPRA